MKNTKFTAADYKKMKNQPSVFRADGGSVAWRKASEACFNDEKTALDEINASLNALEIEDIKRLLKA